MWQAPPLSNFCEHVESLWHDPDSLVWQGENMEDIAFGDSETRTARSNMSRTGPQRQHMRQIISSAELGIVLIGSLEVLLIAFILQIFLLSLIFEIHLLLRLGSDVLEVINAPGSPT
jgi:hypothetical protein